MNFKLIILVFMLLFQLCVKLISQNNNANFDNIPPINYLQINLGYNQKINDNSKILVLSAGMFIDYPNNDATSTISMLNIGISKKINFMDNCYYGSFNVLDLMVNPKPIFSNKSDKQFENTNIYNIKIINYNRTGIYDVDTKWVEFGFGKSLNFYSNINSTNYSKISAFLNAGIWTLKLGKEIFGNISDDINTQFTSRINLIFLTNFQNFSFEQNNSAEIFTMNPSIYILNFGVKLNYHIVENIGLENLGIYLKRFTFSVKYDYKRIIAENKFNENHFVFLQFVYNFYADIYNIKLYVNTNKNR